MTLLPCLILAAVAGPPAFELIDAETVAGRPVNRFRALELGETPVRPVAWEVAPPPGVRHGLVPVGPQTDSAPAVAWDPAASALWLDADGDRRLTPAERVEVKPGAAAAVLVTIAGGADPVRRTLLVRPGLLGGGPRYTVRGCMAGTLNLGGKAVRTLLIDGNADGCFDAAGVDRVWVDLDGDGRFDPVSEQFPLGSPIRAGGTSYTVASDPWARSVAAHERDPRLGRVRLALGGPAAAGKVEVVSVSASLVGETGELITVQALDSPAEAPVGRYRVAGLTLELADDAGRVWSYTFRGGRAGAIDVAPAGEARAGLLDGLALDVATDAHGGSTGPGGEIDTTPHLRLASGLYLAACTSKAGAAVRGQERTAAVVLRGPGGAELDRVASGFA